MRLILALLLAGGTAFALNPADFPLTTLAAFQAKHPSDAPGYIFAAPIEGLSLRASFSGKFRPLSAGTQAFLQAYAKTLSGSTNNVASLSIYREEVLVNELDRGEPIWLPIQPQVAQAMRAEMKPNGTMKLWMRYLGQSVIGPQGKFTYALIDFTAFNDGAVGTIQNNGPTKKTWAQVCEQSHCQSPDAQFLHPPLPFYLEGKLTGASRLTPPQFAAHMTAYGQRFPGAFQLPIAQILPLFSKQVELRESGSGRSIWLPVPKAVVDKLPTLTGSPVSIYAGAYGTEKGELDLMGIEVKPAAQ